MLNRPSDLLGRPALLARPASSYRRLLLATVSVMTLAAYSDASARQPGVSAASGATALAVNAATTASQQASAIAKQSRLALSRAAQTIQAMQAAQAVARAAALARQTSTTAPTSIPDGLTEGGLQVATGATAGSSLWRGASLPTQTTVGGQANVTIDQTASQAILTWNTFNIGANTTLNFNQHGNAGWIAFNRVSSDTAPSQILGSLKADGQVYVINRNGIIFGGASQVNVGTLVASALPINDALLDAGILFSNSENKYTFSAYSIAAGTTTDGFDAPAATARSQASTVVVEVGARISTVTTSDHNGGRVILIGPQVVNSGTILTPDGQTILAAGQQVMLLPHASGDPSLRGLDVSIGSVLAPVIGVPGPDPSVAANVSSLVTGVATNSGLILAERGNITMAGASVNQNGVLASTTSVSLNGRIDLQASYAADASLLNSSLATATGAVSLGNGSLTQILPEIDSADRVVGTSLALASQINMTGNTVYLGQNSQVLAPSGNVTINAGSYFNKQLVYTDGQIYLDTGATIDVFGSIVMAPVSENIVAVQLLGPQLADSPLQRNGFLRQQTIYVDIRKSGTNADGTTWIGTPLADVTGYIGLIKRTVGELTTAGGAVMLNAGASVVMKTGASLNVSNGWIDYQGGVVQTTRLIGADGRLYDISQASPDQVYVGFAGQWTRSHAHWNFDETFTSPLANSTVYQAGYIQGGAGGSVAIQAPAVALDGDMQGGTASGERQRLIRPAASSFTLLLAGTASNSTALVTPAITQDVIFQAGIGARYNAAFDPNVRALDTSQPIYLSPDLVGATGFGSIGIDTKNGDIRVVSQLSGTAGGAIALTARNLDIEASITLPGGTLSLNAVALDPSKVLTNGLGVAADVAGRGAITLGSGAAVSLAGLIRDDQTAPSRTSPTVLNGGSFSASGLFVDLKDATTIDVSSGVVISAQGKQTAGNGGSIAISGGQASSVDPSVLGKLVIGSTLKGYGTGKGGSLSITARAVQIGGTTTRADTLLLRPEFFSTGGFSSFKLTGYGITDTAGNVLPSVYIAPGTVIEPVVASYKTSATSTGTVLAATLLEPEYRSAVSLSFIANGSYDLVGLSARGEFLLDAGASIRLDPNANATGSVAINSFGKASTAVILGSIVVPGGSIGINVNADMVDLLTSSVLGPDSVVLGATSVLSTRGFAVMLPDVTGRRAGTLWGGGTITVAGNILAEAGAVLDVSGAAAVFDLATARQNLASSGNAVRLERDAGTITFNARNAFYSEATLLGEAGGASALGGNLVITASASTDVMPTSFENLLITQSRMQGISYAHGRAAIGANVTRNGSGLRLASFAIDSFTAGGFDALKLGGNVMFSGPVTIAARRSLTVATGGLLTADPTVAGSALSLSAPYVAIGQSYAAPALTAGQPSVATSILPSYGTGSVAVVASDLLDVGYLSLQNIRTTGLSSDGDIRGYGTFEAAGTVALTAAQTYPTSAAIFTIVAVDSTAGAGDGLVTISATGAPRQLPLSAGGQLNIYASNIVQDGVLRAPFGTINLGSVSAVTATTPGGTQALPTTLSLKLGADSVTSVSAIDPLTGEGIVVPYGTVPNGTAWIDPYGNDISTGGVATKTISLAGAATNISSGAVIDLRGGGDLYAANWVKGLGGSKDILASSTSYAIVPSYHSNYAPLVSSTEAGWSAADLAVGDQITLTAASNGLAAGTYTLLPARYALLPGAFLVTSVKGSPQDVLSVAKPDGSSIVSGYRANTLNASRVVSMQPSLFEIASSAVVNARAQYDGYSGTKTLASLAVAGGAAVPRLPIDGGTLNLVATASLIVQGAALMSAGPGGLGGLVNISSPNDIVINNSGTGAAAHTLYLSSTGLSAFGAESLLIGGSRTSTSAGLVVSVTTGSIEVANDESGAFTGPEIILVSNGALKVDAGAVIEQRGSLSSPAQTLLLGYVPGVQSSSSTSKPIVLGGGNTSVAVAKYDQTSKSTLTLPSAVASGVFTSTVSGTITNGNISTGFAAGSTLPAIAAGSVITFDADGTLAMVPASGIGNGALLRVSSDVAAKISRSGVAPNASGSISVGAGATISGTSVILDSTGTGTLDPTAHIAARAVALSSGKVSLQLANAGALQANPGLVLANSVLADLQRTIDSLSLLSYSALDIYGSGHVGDTDAAGEPVIDSLVLHAASIRGFNIGGGTVTFSAKSISLDNGSNGAALGAVAGVNDVPSGTLTFNADTLTIGANVLNVAGYAALNLVAGHGLLAQGSGSLTTAGNLTVTTPLISGGTAAKQKLAASGVLTVNGSSGTVASTLAAGLGASLTLEGGSVVENAKIWLPTGLLTLHATTGDITVSGTLDASGTAQVFNDQIRYTGGGQIAVTADNGSVLLTSDSVVNVSAKSVAGNAGALAVSAGQGTFSSAGSLLGQAGSGGSGGVFTLDVGSQPTMATLSASLNAGGFNQTRAVRVRTGNVTIDGTATAHNFVVSADAGEINVTGTIDASGVTGGQIGLYGYNGVKLAAGSLLSVAAQQFDAAGKGGVVDLETGTAKSINGVMTSGVGWIDIQSGSTIDLSVAGGVGGTLHLRAPQITGSDGAGNPIPTAVNSVAGGSDVAIKPLAGNIVNASSVVVEGFQVFDLTSSGGVVDTTAETNIDSNGKNFASIANTAAMTSRLLGGTPNAGLGAAFHVQPGEEIVSQGQQLPLTLNTAGSTLSIAAGSKVSFPSGVAAGDVVSFSAAGRITHADGSSVAFAADSAVTLAAGDSVTLDGAGTLTFVSGSSPIVLSLSGLATSSTGAGTSTRLNAGATGLGLVLRPGGIVSLPGTAGSVLTFPTALPVGDSFVTSVSGTLTIPTGGLAGSLVLPVNSSYGLGTATSLVIPAGGKIKTNATASAIVGSASSSGVTTIVLASGDTIKMASTAITIPMAAGAAAGATAIASGDSLNLTATSYTLARFTATTSGWTVNSSGVGVTHFAAGGTVTVTAATVRIVLDNPGSVTFGSTNQGTNGVFTYRSSTNNTAIITPSASGTVAATSGTITSLTDTATVSGTITLLGSAQSMNVPLYAGSTNTIPSGLVVTSVPLNSTFTTTTSGNLTLSGGTAYGVKISSGAFGFAGQVDLTLSGDLTLSSNWDFAGYRYGPAVNAAIKGSGEPGVLTLRAPGNIILQGSLSDGFTAASGLSAPYSALNATTRLWQQVLLPSGARSWSYRLTAGADLSAADFHQVTPVEKLPDGVGSVQLGIPGSISATGDDATALATYYQVIRTGTGDIDIAAGRDVQLLNTFASIYTAGTQVTPIATRTLATGGSVTLAANVPITIPTTPSGEVITATSNGFITYQPSAQSAVAIGNLPVGTVFTFPLGFSSPISPTLTLTPTALRTQLVAPSPNSQVQLTAVGSSIGNIAAGAKTTIGSSGTVTVTPSSSGTYYSKDSTTTPPTYTVIRFSANQPLPAGASGYIVLDNGGSFTLSSGSSATLVLDAGTFTVTAAAASGVKFGYIPAGGTLTNLTVGGLTGSVGTASNNIPLVATIPLVAGTATTLLPGSNAITLAGGGIVTLVSGTAATYTQPASTGTSYAFDTPVPAGVSSAQTVPIATNAYYLPQYSTAGGNVTIAAKQDIVHLTSGGADDSTQEIPINWLYRRSGVINGQFAQGFSGDVASTTWWVDYSNFFEGVGALGGGNVKMTAGRDVKNVDGVVPTNAWMPKSTTTVTSAGTVVDKLAADQPLFEYGGGNLTVVAGRDINGGVYYVEKGEGALTAGSTITTNATRSTLASATPIGSTAAVYSADPAAWLPTTLFLGKGSFEVSAGSDIVLGAVANPFLLPQGILNGAWNRSYFSTYAPTSEVDVTSLTGSITIKDTAQKTSSIAPGTLAAWFTRVLNTQSQSVGSVAKNRSWLRLTEVTSNLDGVGKVYAEMIGFMPPTLEATAFTGDINIVGSITLAPSPVGTIDLLAANSISGLTKLGSAYNTGIINVSDADPAKVPSIIAPLLAYAPLNSLELGTALVGEQDVPLGLQLSRTPLLTAFTSLTLETGATTGTNARGLVQQGLHDSDLLHAADPEPIRLYARSGDITGIELFAPKAARIIAGRDIADIAFYLQNLSAVDVSMVVAGRDIIAYDANTPLRQAASAALIGLGSQEGTTNPWPGDISIGGPGTLEVLAGRNLDLGGATAISTVVTANSNNSTALGIVSIGNGRNPYLPFRDGADIVAAAGLSGLAGPGLAASAANFNAFIADFLDPATVGTQALRYLPELGGLLGIGGADTGVIWKVYRQLTVEQQYQRALDIFYLVLRDAGRDHNDANSAGFNNYAAGYKAIADLFPGDAWRGDISLTAHEIKTASGGNISLLAPGGQLLVGYNLDASKQPLDQGIMTLGGGDISIFAKHNVTLGTSRIFTFKGGDEVIWSTLGNIASGSASKTLQSAPPARYLIDPQSGASILDLAGLATGGGIGVLQTLKDVPAGNVDLVAPSGIVDAGDAGIRSSGNVTISALQILNTFNIQAQGTTIGVPVAQAPNIGGLTSASNVAGAAAHQDATPGQSAGAQQPSIIIVEVLGYGDPGDPADQEKRRKDRDRHSYDPNAPVQILGHGPLTEVQMGSLTAEEKQRKGGLVTERDR